MTVIASHDGLKCWGVAWIFKRRLSLRWFPPWEELVKPDEQCSIHVEYQNKPGTAVDSLQVGAVYKGRNSLVCNYSLLTAGASHLRGTQFANSYTSQTLVKALDYMMQNQTPFPSGSIRILMPLTFSFRASSSRLSARPKNNRCSELLRIAVWACVTFYTCAAFRF